MNFVRSKDRANVSAQATGISLMNGITKNKNVPIRLKNKCTRAIARPAIFPVIAASIAVAVVPILAPTVTG